MTHVAQYLDELYNQLDADPARQELEATIITLIERKRFTREGSAARRFIEHQLNGLLDTREYAVDFVSYHDPEFNLYRY